ncbi:MAG: hypothetical protein RBS43_10265 [Candidatus Cloacimonas sp.]|jgi:TPR repeat protein|nr:hypothetical protein [Candidatus Cloacimonas sp.]
MKDVKALKRKALVGDINAILDLAHMYNVGDCVEQNYLEAAKWYLCAGLHEPKFIDAWLITLKDADCTASKLFDYRQAIYQDLMKELAEILIDMNNEIKSEKS